MRIACLGWGSLIWNPKDLPIVNRNPEQWFTSGPVLPIEFARESRDKRITLVIIPEEKCKSYVQTLWNIMVLKNFDTTIEPLRDQEGT